MYRQLNEMVLSSIELEGFCIIPVFNTIYTTEHLIRIAKCENTPQMNIELRHKGQWTKNANKLTLFLNVIKRVSSSHLCICCEHSFCSTSWYWCIAQSSTTPSNSPETQSPSSLSPLHFPFPFVCPRFFLPVGVELHYVGRHPCIGKQTEWFDHPPRQRQERRKQFWVLGRSRGDSIVGFIDFALYFKPWLGGFGWR